MYHSVITEVKHSGQTKNTRIIDSKPLINTYYRIGYGSELKYLLLAQSEDSLARQPLGAPIAQRTGQRA